MAELEAAVAVQAAEGGGSRARTDWAGLVAAWKVSGQSQTRFCQDRGLSRYRFGQWKVKLEGRDRRGGVRLVKVKGMKVGPAGGEGGAGALRLGVGGRYTVQVCGDFDAVTLGRLLDVLEGR